LVCVSMCWNWWSLMVAWWYWRSWKVLECAFMDMSWWFVDDAIGRGGCYRCWSDLHMIEMVHGTLIELSTRSSLGLHVYAYEENFFSDVMAWLWCYKGCIGALDALQLVQSFDGKWRTFWHTFQPCLLALLGQLGSDTWETCLIHLQRCQMLC